MLGFIKSLVGTFFCAEADCMASWRWASSCCWLDSTEVGSTGADPIIHRQVDIDIKYSQIYRWIDFAEVGSTGVYPIIHRQVDIDIKYSQIYRWIDFAEVGSTGADPIIHRQVDIDRYIDGQMINAR